MSELTVDVVVPSLEVLTNPEKAARCLLHARHAVQRALEMKEGAEAQAAYFLIEKEKLATEMQALKQELSATKTRLIERERRSLELLVHS